MTRMQNEIVDLKEENKILKAKCCSLERSMKDEQKWEHSAPDIPTSYWHNQYFDGDYIECMEGFLRQIKQVTCDLRNDGIDHGIFFGDADNETALLYDDLLLPHWEEFANALQLYQEEEPFDISIYNLQLSASVIDLLKPVLKHKPIVLQI